MLYPIDTEEKEIPARSKIDAKMIGYAVDKVDLTEQKQILREVFSHEYLRSLNLSMEIREVPHWQHKVANTHRIEIIFTPDTVDENGEINQTAVSRREFETSVRGSIHIKPEWYLRTFKIVDARGRIKRYTIKEYNRRATTYPVICECECNGKRTIMKCSEKFVRNGLLHA
jgi:hypothetical protein